MKKTLSLILAALMLAAFCLGAVSCSKEAKLVGTWKAENGGTITFEDDGDFSIKGNSKGIFANLSISGKWEIKDGKLELTYKLLLVDTTKAYDFTVKGKTLSIIDGDNTDTYTKEK